MATDPIRIDPENGQRWGDRASEREHSLRLFEQHRPMLFGIAYRMMGTVAEAEDAVQDAFLRWQGVSIHQVDSPQAFLITIVSRLCLNQLQSARAQREEYVGQWLPEPLLTGPSSDLSAGMVKQDSLSFAFLLLLERLTPVERAVFVLRELFDLDYERIAEIIGKTEANCRQILRRARKYVAENRPRFEASVEQRDKLLKEFLNATASGNMQELVMLLSDDAAFYSDGGGKGPAVPNVVLGRDNVSRLILGAIRKLLPPGLVRQVVEVNGQPAIATWLGASPYSVIYIDVDTAHIRNIYVVTNPDKLGCLQNIGAPSSLAEGSSPVTRNVLRRSSIT